MTIIAILMAVLLHLPLILIMCVFACVLANLCAFVFNVNVISRRCFEAIVLYVQFYKAASMKYHNPDTFT